MPCAPHLLPHVQIESKQEGTAMKVGVTGMGLLMVITWMVAKGTDGGAPGRAGR
jgi:hypothetical protein